MELDDLKARWAEHDARIDAGIRLNTRLLRESLFGKVDAQLKPLSRWILLEGFANFAVVLLLGSFLGDHIGQPRFALPAGLLFVCALALLNAGIRHFVALRTIDYAAPVVAIQKRLAAVRVSRIRTTKWVFLLSPLLWTPLLIVGIQSLTGADPYAFLDGKWLAGNLIFGVMVIVGALWLSHAYGDRWNRWPSMHRLMDDVAGRSLVSATGFLDEIARFEREP